MSVSLLDMPLEVAVEILDPCQSPICTLSHSRAPNSPSTYDRIVLDSRSVETRSRCPPRRTTTAIRHHPSFAYQEEARENKTHPLLFTLCLFSRRQPSYTARLARSTPTCSPIPRDWKNGDDRGPPCPTRSARCATADTTRCRRTCSTRIHRCILQLVANKRVSPPSFVTEDEHLAASGQGETRSSFSSSNSASSSAAKLTAAAAATKGTSSTR